MHSSKSFYTKLKVQHLSLNQLLKDVEDFESIPEDWFIIMTDVVNSTEHLEAKKYQEVNLVAVSSVSVVLNVARRHGTTIPFVYGGDGGTTMIPPAMLADCKSKLATLHHNTWKSLKMDLRVSIVPMREIMNSGFSIRVAKLYISSHYHQAIFLGEGIRYAETLMKQNPEYLLPKNTKQRPIDLSGLECKWNALFPPRPDDEVVSLIIQPGGKKEPQQVFHDVLEHIEKLYGTFEERHPINPKTLSPTTHFKTIFYASHLRYGRVKMRYVLYHFLGGLIKSVRLSLRVFWDKLFIGESPDVSTSSDTLKIDNTLKTIFAGPPAQRVLLTKWLREQEKKGDLLYGINVAQASVMTCYIKESTNTHIRFLDGFGGGYTLAAVELKKKIKKINS